MYAQTCKKFYILRLQNNKQTLFPMQRIANSHIYVTKILILTPIARSYPTGTKWNDFKIEMWPKAVVFVLDIRVLTLIEQTKFHENCHV